MTAPPIRDTAGRPASELSGATAENSTPTPYVKKAGDTMTGDLTVTHVIGDGSGLTNLDFAKIAPLTLPATLAGHGITNGVTTAMIGVASGVAGLDSGGKVPTSELPAFSVSNTYVVASQAAMLALSAAQGDLAVRTDLSQTFILTALPASTLANWVQLLSPTSPVSSVFGRTGAVVGAANDYAWNQLSGTPTTIDGLGVTADFDAKGDARWFPILSPTVSDNTIRANNSSSAGTPSTVGGAYLAWGVATPYVDQSGWSIVSNKIVDTGDDTLKPYGTVGMLVTNTGSPLMDISGGMLSTYPFTSMLGGAFFGLVGRGIDLNNYLFAFMGPGSTIYLNKMVAGVQSGLGSGELGFSPAVSTLYTMRLVCIGNTIQVYVNGALCITTVLTGSDATLFGGAGATYAGFYASRRRYAPNPSSFQFGPLLVASPTIYSYGDARYALLGHTHLFADITDNVPFGRINFTGAITAGHFLDGDGAFKSMRYEYIFPITPPAHYNTGSGIKGQIAFDATYLYACTNTTPSTWGRIALDFAF